MGFISPSNNCKPEKTIPKEPTSTRIIFNGRTMYKATVRDTSRRPYLTTHTGSPQTTAHGAKVIAEAWIREWGR